MVNEKAKTRAKREVEEKTNKFYFPKRFLLGFLISFLLSLKKLVLFARGISNKVAKVISNTKT